MKKIKIFTEGTQDTFAGLELKVNQWLKRNRKNIKIISLHVTSTCGINVLNREFVNLTIVIFYKLVG